MVRPLIALIACSLLATACATSPRAVNGPPPPTPARRGDTTTARDTTKRDTSAMRDMRANRADASTAFEHYLEVPGAH